MSPCELYVSCVDELEEDIAHSRSFAHCPFRPQARHSVFALNYFSRRRQSSSDKRDGRTGYLAFALTFSSVLPERKASSHIGLYQLCTHFRVKIIVSRVGEQCNSIQFGCLENSNIIKSNIRRKRVVFLGIIIVQNFFSVITSGVNWVIVG